MWNLLFESVPGVSHEAAGLPCQDYSLGCLVERGGETVLLLACADGAGSAEHAAVGAKLAAEELAAEIRRALESGVSVAEIDHGLMTEWHRRVRDAVSSEAERRSAR